MLNLELFVTDMLEKINNSCLKPGAMDIRTGTERPTFDSVTKELNEAAAEAKRMLKIVDYLRTVHSDRMHFETARQIKPAELIEAIMTMDKHEKERVHEMVQREKERLEAAQAFQKATENAQIRPMGEF